MFYVSTKKNLRCFRHGSNRESDNRLSLETNVLAKEAQNLKLPLDIIRYLLLKLLNLHLLSLEISFFHCKHLYFHKIINSTQCIFPYQQIL